MNSITESNKMIAEFMGYKYFPWNTPATDNIPNVAGWHKPTMEGHPHLPSMQKIQGWYLCRRDAELRYSNSWDWLMPVVENIEHIKGVTVILTTNTGCEIFYFGKLIYKHNGEYSKFIGIYNGVVEFIKQKHITNKKAPYHHD